MTKLLVLTSGNIAINQNLNRSICITFKKVKIAYTKKQPTSMDTGAHRSSYPACYLVLHKNVSKPVYSDFKACVKQ